MLRVRTARLRSARRPHLARIAARRRRGTRAPGHFQNTRAERASEFAQRSAGHEEITKKRWHGRGRHALRRRQALAQRRAKRSALRRPARLTGRGRFRQQGLTNSKDDAPRLHDEGARRTSAGLRPLYCGALLGDLRTSNDRAAAECLALLVRVAGRRPRRSSLRP